LIAIYLAFARTNTGHLHLHQSPSRSHQSESRTLRKPATPHGVAQSSAAPDPDRPRATRHTPAGIPAKPINRCPYPLFILRCQANGQMKLFDAVDGVSLCHASYFGPSAICDHLLLSRPLQPGDLACDVDEERPSRRGIRLPARGGGYTKSLISFCVDD